MVDSFTDAQREIAEMIPALRAFARGLAHNPYDADDLVQETLMKAIANLHQFKPGTNLKSWLFTILRNTFYTSLRVSRRESPGSVHCASEDCGRLSDQEWAVRKEEIRRALEMLPDDQREVIVMVGALGVSYEEAASICGCAVGTIKSRLNRARHRLLLHLSAGDAAELFADDRRHNTETTAFAFP